MVAGDVRLVTLFLNFFNYGKENKRIHPLGGCGMASSLMPPNCPALTVAFNGRQFLICAGQTFPAPNIMKSFNVVRLVVYSEVVQVTAENEYEAIELAYKEPVGTELEFVETGHYYAEEF